MAKDTNEWTTPQREAVREFLGTIQPHNPTVLVTNIEDVMPVTWRRGFETMFAKLAAVAVLVMLAVGCGDNAPEPSPHCDTSAEMCRAALELAETNCDRRLRCDVEYTPTLEECVEWTMLELCDLVDCSASYARSDELEACLTAYSEAACDAPVTVCGLVTP